MVEGHPQFSIWSFLTEGDCTIAVSPYDKYRGGISARDVQALIKTAAALSQVIPSRRLHVESIEHFEQKDWMSNQVLIGGRLSNQAIRFFTDTWARISTPTSLVLDRNLIRDTLRKSGQDHLTPSFRSGLPFTIENTIADYGMIVCLPNPILGKDKRLIAVSGIKGWGSLAAAEAFSNPDYYQPLDKILKGLGFDPGGSDKNAVVEIVLHANVVERRKGDQTHSELGEIQPVLVRLDNDIHRQWENPKYRTAWGNPFKEEPRTLPVTITLSAIFGGTREEKDCLVSLDGVISYYDLVETSLSDKRIDELNNKVTGFNQIRDTVQQLAERVRPDLVHALPAKFLTALEIARTHVQLPQQVQIHIIGKPNLIKFPFELVELTPGDYLAWRHPISRSLIGQVRTRPTLGPQMLNGLRAADDRLRVLLVSSNPTGDLVYIRQEIDEIALQLETVRKYTNLAIEIKILEKRESTALALKQNLIEGHPHIVHFVGHAFFDDRNPDRSYLLLDGSSKKGQPVYATELCEWSRQSSDLSFFYLSTCEGAASAEDKCRHHSDFLGIADALMRVGVPAILGYRWPVSDIGARLLAVSFYRALFMPQWSTPTQALFVARSELAAVKRVDPVWLAPILVSHIE
jgi:CHAT domain-containing protein